MYDIVRIFNSTLRDQAFSNPFEYIMDNQLAAILFFSLFGSVVLKKIAFTMCGVFYKRKSNKTLGSIVYMFFYCINIQVLIKLCQWFKDINLVISIYMLFVIALFIVLYKVKNGIRQNIV
ncbi:MAG: hypothetical protein J6M60_06530 [Clostridia bacterium]|nr:hypothetical protein [Clostridia bacterium]